MSNSEKFGGKLSSNGVQYARGFWRKFQFMCSAVYVRSYISLWNWQILRSVHCSLLFASVASRRPRQHRMMCENRRAENEGGRVSHFVRSDFVWRQAIDNVRSVMQVENYYHVDLTLCERKALAASKVLFLPASTFRIRHSLCILSLPSRPARPALSLSHFERNDTERAHMLWQLVAINMLSLTRRSKAAWAQLRKRNTFSQYE